MNKFYLLILFALSAYVGQAQASPKAVNDFATIVQPDSVVLNVLANDSNFNSPDTIIITALFDTTSGWVTVRGGSRIVYRALDRQFYGLDTFYYISCDTRLQTLCDTGRVVIDVLRRPKPVNDLVTILQPDSAYVNVLGNDSNFNAPDTLCITNIWTTTHGPAGWATLHGCDSIFLRPLNAQFYGLDTIYYRSCETHIATSTTLCDTGILFVNVILPPKAVIDTANLTEPDTITISPLVNDTLYNVIDSTCITSLWGVPAAWMSVQGCGQIVYHPTDFHHAGIDTIHYISCYSQTPSVCDTGTIVVTVVLNPPFPDFVYTSNGHCQATIENASLLSDSVHWTVQFLTGNGTDTTLGNVNSFVVAAYNDTAFQAEVCVTAINPSGPATICYDFYIDCSGSSGIGEIASANVRIYPNPATDQITIDLSKLDPSLMTGSSTIEVYDMIGKQVKQSVISNLTTMSVSDLSNGVYMIALHQGSTHQVLGKFEVIR